MDIRLKRYKRDFEHSYCFGVFPTLELLQHRPQDVLKVVVHPKGLKNAGVTKIHEFCKDFGIPFEIQEKTLSRIGARENDYAAGVFRIAETELELTTNHIILVNPIGMGNLGTIIRTMLGFGFRDLAIIEPSADICHPETVRASMGAIFSVNYGKFAEFEAYRNLYPRNWYLLMTDGSVSLPDVSFEPPFGLIFGNESAGLPKGFGSIGTNVSIPQSDAVDSLNLAVSVGITLYQASQ